MFYIVEEDTKLLILENLIKDGCYVEVIPTNDIIHPIFTDTVALYIKTLNTKEGYIIPIKHDEGLNVSKQRVYELLKKSSKVYTFNKKKLLYHFNLQDTIDVSLLYSMNKFDKLDISVNIPVITHFYNKYPTKSNLNQLIPLSKLYERSEETFNIVENVLELQIPQGFNFYNKYATNIFYMLETKGIGVDLEKFEQVFKPKYKGINVHNDTVFTEYNLYNPTSRPTNTYNSVNFAAIPKDINHRSCFTPQNDYFVEVDFDGYHLRLLSELINYELNEESAHIQLAKLYFNKEEITEEEYDKAKQINFHAIYGKVPKEHENLEFFRKLIDFKSKLWEDYNKKGYIEDFISNKPFTKELTDMNPAKLMNYLMQSLETSNNIKTLLKLLKFLREKKSFVTLYTYDAVLFDFSKEDGKDTLLQIKSIMEQEGKFPVKFKYNTNLML